MLWLGGPRSFCSADLLITGAARSLSGQKRQSIGAACGTARARERSLSAHPAGRSGDDLFHLDQIGMKIAHVAVQALLRVGSMEMLHHLADEVPRSVQPEVLDLKMLQDKARGVIVVRAR
jgi:hypothetical protein